MNTFSENRNDDYCTRGFRGFAYPDLLPFLEGGCSVGPTRLVLGGLGKNTDQIPRISGAHHFLSRIIGIKFPEFMPAAQRHLSKIWPFLPWRKLENQVEVFLLAF